MYKLIKNKHKWCIIDKNKNIIKLFITRKDALHFIKISYNSQVIKKHTTLFFN
jgi:hypothetical protein